MENSQRFHQKVFVIGLLLAMMTLFLQGPAEAQWKKDKESTVISKVLVTEDGKAIQSDFTPREKKIKSLKAPFYKPVLRNMESIKLTQDFEGTFPPTGWTNSGSWIKGAASGYGIGSGSAGFPFYSVVSGSFTLTSVAFPATVAGDSIKFDHAWANYSTPASDSIVILASPNGTDFEEIGRYCNTDAVGTGLVTASPTGSAFTPTAGQWGTKKLALPVGTTVIRFKAVSDFGNNFYADNFQIGEPVANDIAAFSFDNPANGSNVVPGSPFTPTASFRNLGTAEQTNVSVKYEINHTTFGNQYTSTKSIASIAAGATQQVTFDAFPAGLVAGEFTLKLSVLTPDEDPANDILNGTLNSKPPMSGPYTIGGTTPDYANFTTAIEDLVVRGVSGPVTFNVRPGVYGTDAGTEPDTTLQIDPIQGASATNTITFQKESGTVVIERTGTSSTGDVMVYFNGCDYVTFDGIDIRQRAGSNAVEYGYYIANGSATDGANYNTIKNFSATFNGVANANLNIAVVLESYGATSASGANTYNKIYNFNISGAAYGILAFGSSATYPDQFNEIGGGASTLSFQSTTGSSIGIVYSAQQSLKIYGIDITRGTTNVSGAFLIGISSGQGFTGTYASTADIYDNKIHGITHLNASSGNVRVISTNVAGGSYNIYRNTIYSDTVTTTASGFVSGIGIEANSTYNIYNNIIYDLVSITGTATGNANNIQGIRVNNGTVNAYYNTIFLNSPNATASRNSTCLYIMTGAVSVDYRNNIFVNNSASGIGTTGRQSVICKAVADLANITGTSNNNLLYAGTGPFHNKRAIFFEAGGSTYDTTIAQYRTRLGPTRETFSVTENVPFINTATLPYDLHVDSLVATQVQEGAQVITGFTTDIDNQTRNVSKPDIGADEGNFTFGDPEAPAITYTNLSNAPPNSAQTLTASVSDFRSGVPQTGIGLPVAYWKINTAGAWTAATGTYTTGNNYEFTFGLGTVLGDTVFYYVVAQDAFTTPNVTSFPLGSGFTANPPTAATPPAAPNYYLISTPISGTITVGTTTGTYATLQAAFAVINNQVVNGNLTVEIQAEGTTETATATLNAVSYYGAPYYPIVIKPAAATTPLVVSNFAGAIIDLNGADYVTVNGMDALTLRNTNAAGPAILFRNDATYDSVTRCIIETGNTSTTSGSIVFSTSTGTLGNRYIVIYDNDIRNRSDAAGNPANAIYSSGTASASNKFNTIAYNNIFNWTTMGINMTATGNGDGWTIDNNSLYQTASRTAALTAINVLGAGNSHVVTNNNIGGAAADRSGAPMSSTTGLFNAIVLATGTTTAASVQGNKISNIAWYGTSSCKGISVTGGNVNIGTVAGNIIGGGTAAYDTILMSYDNDMISNTGSGVVNIENNVIGNISYYRKSGDRTCGIYASGGTVSIKNNLIRDLKSNSSSTGTSFIPVGIYFSSGIANGNIEGNAIYNITNTYDTTVALSSFGILTSGVASTTTIHKNTISSIKAVGTGTGTNAAFARGIYISGGTGLYRNNVINIGSQVGNDIRVNGIENAGSSISRIFNNTIQVTGAGTGANHSFAYYRSSTAGDTLRNNLLINKRTGGTGNHYAIGTVGTWANAQSNYNAFYAPVADSVARYNNASLSLAGWQTAATADARTYVNDVNFVDPDNNDFHLDGTSRIDTTLRGIALPLVTTDIDGEARHAMRPYKGVDESAPYVAGAIDDVIFDEDFGMEFISELNDVFGVPTTYTAETVNGKVATYISGDSLYLQSVQDAFGSDVVTVTANYGIFELTETFNVTVNNINDAPVITGIPDILMEEDVPVVLALNNYITDSDHDSSEIFVDANVYSANPIEGKKLLATKVTKKANGGKTIEVGTGDLIIDIDGLTNVATFSTTMDSSGVFEVEFWAVDDGGYGDVSNYDTVTVTVEPRGETPFIANAIDDLETYEDFDTPFETSLLPVFGDVDSPVLTYSVETSNPGVLASIVDDTMLVLSSVLNFNGTVDVYVKATDDSLLSVTDTFTVTIASINDAPTVAEGIEDLQVFVNQGKVFIAKLDSVFADVDTDDELVFTADTLSFGLTTEISGDSLFIITNLDFSGFVDVKVTATDDSLAFVTDTFTVNVFGNPPVVTAPIADVEADEDFDAFDHVMNLNTVFTDADLDPLTFAIVSSNGVTATIVDDTTLHIANVPDWNGIATVIVSATDGPFTSTDTFEVTVNSINDAPVLAAIPDVITNEDVPAMLYLNRYVADADHDSTLIDFGVSVLSADPLVEKLASKVTRKQNGGMTIEVGTGDLLIDIDSMNVATFSTTMDSSGVFDVEFWAIDDSGAVSNYDTITVTVNPVDDTPYVANPIADLNLDEDFGTVSVILTNVFDDVDTEILTVDAVALSANIGLALTNDTLVITSVQDYFGSVDVVVTADDGNSTVSDTFTVNIAAVNDAPIVAGLPDLSFPEGGGTSLRLSEYVLDVDNDTTQITWSGTVITVNPVLMVTRKVLAMDGDEAVHTVKTNVELPIKTTTDKEGNLTIEAGIGDLTISINNTSKVAFFSSPNDSFGVYTVVMTGTDPGALFDTDTMTVTVTPVNDPPTASTLLTPANNSRFVTLPGDTTPVLVSWRKSRDADGQPVIYIVNTSDTLVVTPYGGSSLPDTSFTTTYGDLDEMAEDYGVADGDSIVIYWKVWSVSGTDTVPSVNTFNFKVVRGYYPPIIALSDTLLTKTVSLNGQDSTTFYIFNDGNSDLTYSITEVENVFTELKKDKTQQGYVYEGTGVASPDAEVSPVLQAVSGGYNTEALWDVQFNYDLLALTGSNGKAGVCVTNTEIWVSRWATANIWRFTHAGTLIDSFVVTGVTGVRSLAFDGQFVYAGSANTTISKIDPATRTRVSTITSPVAVRHMSYDPVRNGLWVGNWDTPITCISMTGTTLATLTNSLTGKYGSGYDPYTTGGPYLWVWDQGAGAGSPQLVHQFNLNTLTATGTTFNITSVVTGAGASAIAGGLFITDKLVPGKATMVGVLQGEPNRLFGLELATLGLSWVDVSPTQGTVTPNDSAAVKVFWHGASSPGVLNGFLRIASNDPVTPLSHIRLRMTTVVDVSDNDGLKPSSFALYQNYPNPFNPATTIKYDLKDNAKVTLKIYNSLGQEVRTLVNAKQNAGSYQMNWDGRNDAGMQVSSGVYIYRIQAGNFVKSHKMMFLK